MHYRNGTLYCRSTNRGIEFFSRQILHRMCHMRPFVNRTQHGLNGGPVHIDNGSFTVIDTISNGNLIWRRPFQSRSELDNISIFGESGNFAGKDKLLGQPN